MQTGREAEVHDGLQRAFRRLLILLVSGSVFGVAILTLDETSVRNLGVTLWLFYLQDPVWLIAASMLVGGIQVIWQRGALDGALHLPRIHPIAVALLTLLCCIAGTVWLTGGFPLSLDEFLMTFGGRTLSEGHIVATVDAQWRPYLKAMQPLYVYADAETLSWSPAYMPCMALLLAAMSKLGIADYTNAVLTALSVCLVAVLARRIWPEDRTAPIAAAALLALTPQLLFTGMTQYAMPAHLTFNLAWVCLFLRDTRATHLAALIVGFLSTGLHYVNVHPLFVAPFMIALLYDRRWRLAAFYGLGYVAVLAFWMTWHYTAYWLEGLTPPAGRLGTLPANFLVQLLVLHSPLDLLHWPVNIFRFVSWQSLPMLLLILIALPVMKSAPRSVRLLGWGFILSLVPYVLVTPSPGHGWGYRYLQSLLGSLAIIAVYGWESLSPPQQVRLKRPLVALAALGALTALPLKAFQVHDFTRPYANAAAAVRSSPAEVVLVDVDDTHMGLDLVRNDPFLVQRPGVMALQSLSPRQVRVLCSQFDVAVIRHVDLVHTGIPAGRQPIAERPPQAWTQPLSLRRAGCSPATDRAG